MEQPTLVRLFVRQLMPTFTQTLVSLAVAAVIIVASQVETVSHYLGITHEGVQSFQDILQSQTSGLLSSTFASNFVLIVFWGVIGLIAYLISWAIMNLLIEAGNTVTIDTRYANRGHWRGAGETLAVKTACAAVLIGYLVSFNYGLSLWLGLAQLAITQPIPVHVVGGLVAWLGLSAQLYLVYLLVVLTLTPWYRTAAFTEQRF